MRRVLVIVIAVTLASAAWSHPFDPFGPPNPIVMGRGGSFTATAQGYNSFFYNPAGFARRGELRIASLNAWAFMDQGMVSIAQEIVGSTVPFLSQSPQVAARSIDPAALAALEGLFQDFATWAEAQDPADLETILENVTGEDVESFSEADIADLIAAAGTDDLLRFLEAFEAEAIVVTGSFPFSVQNDLVPLLADALPSGYLRTGAMLGLGWVGDGLGLGLFANAEAVVDGTDILRATGTAFNTITFVGGLGLSFGNLHVGIGIRPTVLGYSMVNAAPVLSSFLSGGAIDLTSMFVNSVYYGSSLGVDVGALYELGPFSFGVAVKDLLGTRIAYRKTTFAEYIQSLASASLPAGSDLTAGEEDDAWTIPMKVNFGMEFHPDLGVMSYLFDPSLSVDLLDVTSTLRTVQEGGQITAEGVLSMFNFGGQIQLLRFLTLRGGYYGGYLSGGLGLKVFVVDINAAVAGDFGPDPSGLWGFSNVGGSLELALRL